MKIKQCSQTILLNNDWWINFVNYLFRSEKGNYRQNVFTRNCYLIYPDEKPRRFKDNYEGLVEQANYFRKRLFKFNNEVMKNPAPKVCKNYQTCFIYFDESNIYKINDIVQQIFTIMKMISRFIPVAAVVHADQLCEDNKNPDYHVHIIWAKPLKSRIGILDMDEIIKYIILREN